MLLNLLVICYCSKLGGLESLSSPYSPPPRLFCLSILCVQFRKDLLTCVLVCCVSSCLHWKRGMGLSLKGAMQESYMIISEL